MRFLMRAKDRDAVWRQRQANAARGKRELLKVTRDWFLSAFAEWEQDRTADNLKALAETWRTWRR
jgi:hypothetical protein